MVGDPFKVTLLFCWKKYKKGLEGSTLIPFLGTVEREEQKIF